MTYEQFIERIMELIKAQTLEGMELSVCTAVKNNGYKRKGICLEKGMLQDYQQIKDKVFYRMVNREKNRELLSQAPHVIYLDFALLFYVLTDMDESGEKINIMLIRNEHLDRWKVAAEEVSRAAWANTEKLFPHKFRIVHAEGLPEDRNMEEGGVGQDEDVYILTNQYMDYGASAILYPHILEQIGVYLDGNYFVLPSSVHEVIIVPENFELLKEDMECVIREVNETQVQAEEFLSDHAYYYDRKKKELIF